MLKKFRITGTQTTMNMCREEWGNDTDVTFGLTCTSGPLGGDAQISSLLVNEDLGAVIFFVDPLSAHPHQADIDSLLRLCYCHNVLLCCTLTSAETTMHVLKIALETNTRELIPSFFTTLESPCVTEYKMQQQLILNKSRPSVRRMIERRASLVSFGEGTLGRTLESVDENQETESVSHCGQGFQSSFPLSSSLTSSITSLPSSLKIESDNAPCFGDITPSVGDMTSMEDSVVSELTETSSKITIDKNREDFMNAMGTLYSAMDVLDVSHHLSHLQGLKPVDNAAVCNDSSTKTSESISTSAKSTRQTKWRKIGKGLKAVLG